MTKYAKLENGVLTYVNSKHVIIDDIHYFSLDNEALANIGVYPVQDIMDDGELVVEDGVIKNYIGKPQEPTEYQLKIAKISGQLKDTQALIEAMERMVAKSGATAEDKAMAAERIALRDELGKTIITENGDGTAMNPYKWSEGQEVTKDMWYKTPSEYIWQAIADGVPANETDTEYFDVVGL